LETRNQRDLGVLRLTNYRVSVEVFHYVTL